MTTASISAPSVPLPERPQLRSQVQMRFESRGVELNLRDGGCLIEFGTVDEATSATAFLESLQNGGTARQALVEQFVGLPVMDVLNQLDTLGLLTETPGSAPPGRMGAQAYRRARRCYNAMLVESSARVPRQLSAVLLNGTVTREQLIGYAVEYYHVVAFCPKVLAPALTHSDDYETTQLVRSFYQAEMNHDRMLLRSLAAVGIDPTATPLLPLPSTFAMMTSLGVHAWQFPLALKAVLFVLEEPQPEFNEAFIECSKRLGMPDGFWKPIAQHSDVNEGESHDDISADLLERVPYVSDEEMVEVEKAVADMVEHLVTAGQEVLDWYGQPGPLRLRWQ